MLEDSAKIPRELSTSKSHVIDEGSEGLMKLQQRIHLEVIYYYIQYTWCYQKVPGHFYFQEFISFQDSDIQKRILYIRFMSRFQKGVADATGEEIMLLLR